MRWDLDRTSAHDNLTLLNEDGPGLGSGNALEANRTNVPVQTVRDLDTPEFPLEGNLTLGLRSLKEQTGQG